VKIDEDVNLVTTKLVGFLTHIKKKKKLKKKSFHDGRLVTSCLMMHVVAHPTTWVRSSPIHYNNL
jgi:hypothetical protein